MGTFAEIQGLNVIDIIDLMKTPDEVTQTKVLVLYITLVMKILLVCSFLNISVV